MLHSPRVAQRKRAWAHNPDLVGGSSHNLKVVSSILTRGKFLFIEGKYYIYKNQNFVISDHIYS